MPIYKLEPRYDETGRARQSRSNTDLECCVIRAASETEARTLARGEDTQSIDKGTQDDWLDPEKVSCTEVPVEGPAEVIETRWWHGVY